MTATINRAGIPDDPIAQRNVDVIDRFFSLYLTDKEAFYDLWVADSPSVITPFATRDVANCTVTTREGWEETKSFWDPIFDEMRGRFDWDVEEIIVGSDPDVIITRSTSAIDVEGGATWGNKRLAYNGRYVQLFRFREGKISSFEEYFDTAVLDSIYGG